MVQSHLSCHVSGISSGEGGGCVASVLPAPLCQACGIDREWLHQETSNNDSISSISFESCIIVLMRYSYKYHQMLISLWNTTNIIKYQYNSRVFYNWLVVTGTWIWCFHRLGMSSSQLIFIFFRGVAQPPTRNDDGKWNTRCLLVNTMI